MTDSEEAAKALKGYEHWDNVLLKEFESESDRACVILAASLLDAAIGELLQSKLAPCPTSSDSLFDGANAPLSTFSSRIDAAYRLGLLSARMCRDLHFVRRIRNDFAHNVTGCKFEESSVRDRIQALANSSKYSTTGERWKSQYPDTPKGHFLFSVGWIQWHIRAITEEMESLPPADEEWGYASSWGDLEKDEDDA